MLIGNRLNVKEIMELEKVENKINVIKGMPKTGVFDQFYYYFLLVFEKRAWEILNNRRKYDIDKIRVLRSTIMSFKSELISLCSKTLIYEIHSEKEENKLSGENIKEQYELFDEKYKNITNVRKILDKYPILKDIIKKKMNAKIEFLNEVLDAIEQCCQMIREEFNISIIELNNISWGTGGDSHNNGKNVLILTVNKNQKIVYKPHSMQSDLQLKDIYDWINIHDEIRYKLCNCKAIDCGSYGWQEYISSTECSSEEEAQKYYYRIGLLLCLFYAIGTQDIHCENLIYFRGMPIVIDTESLFSNKIDSKNQNGLLATYCEEIKNSVYSSILIPQNIQGSLFDIDLSVLGSRSQTRSKKLKGTVIIESGTSNIQMKEVYASSGNEEQRKSIVYYKGNEVIAADYLKYIIEGFDILYRVICRDKKNFLNLILCKKNENRRYRQIFRATYVYYKFLDAVKHPVYLGNEKEYSRVLNIITKNNSIGVKQIAEEEVKALENRDIPYFFTYTNSHDLYFIRNRVEKKIENVFKNTIEENIQINIEKFSDDDLNKQVKFIKYSFANEKMKKPISNTLLKNGSFKNENKFLTLARNIGDLLLDNFVYDKTGTAAVVVGLNANNDGKWVIGCAGATLYDGLGIIIFLSYLYKTTYEDKYRKAALALLKGMEELQLPTNNLSIFLGKGSFLYTYYILYKIYHDQEFFDKCIKIIKTFKNEDILKTQRVDIIDGLAGTIIVLLHIFEECKTFELLSIADEMGKILIDKISNNEMPFMTGMAHGYAGIIYSFTLLNKYSDSYEYRNYIEEMLRQENSKKDNKQSNWLDLRYSEEKISQNYWCHGAPGIILSRLKCIENTDDKTILSMLKKDITYGIVNLTTYEKINGKDCLCHGFWGNIDILLLLSEYDCGLLKLVYEYVDRHLKDISCKGVAFPNDNNEEVYNFMLGLSGMGYVFLRLFEPSIPSVLALDV